MRERWTGAVALNKKVFVPTAIPVFIWRVAAAAISNRAAAVAGTATGITASVTFAKL
jgi:hypothetical protein